jgi:hypothetical protein
VRRLPPEDIRDHVLPVLNDRLAIVGSNGVLNICYVLSALAPSAPTLRNVLLNLASIPRAVDAADILDVVSDPEIPNNLRVDVVKTLHSTGVDASVIAEYLARNSWQAQCTIGLGLIDSDVSEAIAVAFADEVAQTTTYFAPGGPDTFPWESYPDDPICVLLRTAKALGRMIGLRRVTDQNEGRRQEAMWARVASELPEEVRLGTFVSMDSPGGGSWLLWLAHLAIGEVSSESWSRYCAWRRSSQFTDDALAIWQYLAESASPSVALLATADSDELDTYREIALTFAGLSGIIAWNNRLAKMHFELQRLLPQRERSLLFRFGPAAISIEWRQRVQDLLDAQLDEKLQPYAIERDQDSAPAGLSSDIAYQVSSWFAGLPEKSGWRSERRAYSTLLSLIRVGSSASELMKPFLPVLSTFRLSQLVVYIAGLQPLDSSAIRSVIEYLKRAGTYTADEIRVYASVPRKELRRVLLALLPFAVDKDILFADIASSLIIAVCRGAASEGSGATAPIRSGSLDTTQVALCSSDRQYQRDAGISIYVARPPRSVADWERIAALLRTATVREVRDLWSWVVPVAAELSNLPEPWIRHITVLLESGVSDEISVIMSDLLRGLLQKQSQSLDFYAANLGLPRIDQ